VSGPKTAAKHSIKADETKAKPQMVACLERSFEVACTCKLLIASCVAAVQLRKRPFLAACAGVTGGGDGVAQTEAWTGTGISSFPCASVLDSVRASLIHPA